MIRNIELVKSIGADEVIDYNKEDFRTRRDSFEVVLENIGNCTMSQAQLLLKNEWYLSTCRLQKHERDDENQLNR